MSAEDKHSFRVGIESAINLHIALLFKYLLSFMHEKVGCVPNNIFLKHERIPFKLELILPFGARCAKIQPWFLSGEDRENDNH